MNETDRQPSIFGVKVHDLSVPELHGRIYQAIQNRQKSLILHVNVYGLNLAYQLDWLRLLYNQADTVFCDGAGVILGLRILGHRLTERITYADWIWQLAEFSSVNGIRLFFLGARPGVADQAAARLVERYPDLVIVGTHHGYFNKQRESDENQAVIQGINSAKPDLLLIGFGMPLQEAWIRENWPSLEATTTLTGGAVFDYVSGKLKRAPRFLTDHGLEWLGRLIIEPRRLWRRYILGNPIFLLRVLRERFLQRGKSTVYPSG